MASAVVNLKAQSFLLHWSAFPSPHSYLPTLSRMNADHFIHLERKEWKELTWEIRTEIRNIPAEILKPHFMGWPLTNSLIGRDDVILPLLLCTSPDNPCTNLKGRKITWYDKKTWKKPTIKSWGLFHIK